jgi:hypothetical protein
MDQLSFQDGWYGSLGPILEAGGNLDQQTILILTAGIEISEILGAYEKTHQTFVEDLVRQGILGGLYFVLPPANFWRRLR